MFLVTLSAVLAPSVSGAIAALVVVTWLASRFILR